MYIEIGELYTKSRAPGPALLRAGAVAGVRQVDQNLATRGADVLRRK